MSRALSPEGEHPLGTDSGDMSATGGSCFTEPEYLRVGGSGITMLLLLAPTRPGNSRPPILGIPLALLPLSGEGGEAHDMRATRQGHRQVAWCQGVNDARQLLWASQSIDTRPMFAGKRRHGPVPGNPLLARRRRAAPCYGSHMGRGTRAERIHFSPPITSFPCPKASWSLEKKT